MIYAVSSESMRLSDEQTIKNGVSATELMDRAAHALFSLVEKHNASEIAIVCGSGNNGGDGYCLALKLLDSGKSTVIFGKKPKTESAKFYFDKLLAKYPQNYVEIDKMQDLTKFDLVVDCLLGNGFKGKLNEEYIDIINKINEARYIVSCDLPSGLNSDNGKKSPIAVASNQTLAIQSYKTGHFLQDGKDCCGELTICDIGIEVIGRKYYIPDEQFVKSAFPKRAENCHKGNFGRCGIVACSKNYVGAGILAEQAAISTLGECAMRTGVGYSYLFVPESMFPSMWSRVTHSCIFEHSELKNHKLDSIAFGMGIADNDKMFFEVIQNSAIKVIDADGLNILAKNMSCMQKLKGSVLTPHPMEFSRLTGYTTAEILQNPIEIAEQFAKKYQVILLLKGCTTIVTDGDNTYLVTEGTSGQAKGGFGDVLSGVIAGLLAQKIPPLKAAVIGAYIAGRTAKELVKTQCEATILPYDSAKEIGNTLSRILKN